MREVSNMGMVIARETMPCTTAQRTSLIDMHQRTLQHNDPRTVHILHSAQYEQQRHHPQQEHRVALWERYQEGEHEHGETESASSFSFIYGPRLGRRDRG